VAQARVAELEKRVEAREGGTESLRTDPLARERAIREDLGLAKPGEIVVRGLDAAADGGDRDRNPSKFLTNRPSAAHLRISGATPTEGHFCESD
jgi:hypothetical protein